MNIKNRLSKIEGALNINSEFCRCGTPYYNGFVVGEFKTKDITTEICPDCSRKVKPQTIAEFVRQGNYETVVIRPKLYES